VVIHLPSCTTGCCSAAAEDVYKLPEHLREAVDAQYKRDVARVHGEDAGGAMDDEYKSFIQVWLAVSAYVVSMYRHHI